MCCHRRIIYATCGHSTFSPQPLVECRLASIDPTVQWSSGCQIVAHPYKSLRLDRLCPTCQQRREVLLHEIDESSVVRFDEWQWKVSYGMPGHGGKDYWTKKMEERQEAERLKEREKEKGKDTPNSARSTKRFSWRRSRRKRAEPPSDLARNHWASP